MSALSIFVLAILGVIIYPTVKKIVDLNKETRNVLIYLEKKNENAHNLRTSIKKSQEIKNEVASYEKFIYRQGDELKLITTLENIASKNSVTQKIENSNLDNPIGQQINLSLSVNGEYHDVLNYLYDLKQADYFLNISNFYIVPVFDRTTNSASSNVNLRLTLILYVNK